MALSANREVKFYAGQELIDLLVADNVHIYKGAMVGLDATSGYARPLVAGDTFAGVAYHEADNTIAGHSAGGIRVRLHQYVDVVHALAGVTESDIGASVYASDDGTLTLTASGNSLVGKVIAVETTNTARVRLQPFIG